MIGNRSPADRLPSDLQFAIFIIIRPAGVPPRSPRTRPDSSTTPFSVFIRAGDWKFGIPSDEGEINNREYLFRCIFVISWRNEDFRFSVFHTAALCLLSSVGLYRFAVENAMVIASPACEGLSVRVSRKIAPPTEIDCQCTLLSFPRICGFDERDGNFRGLSAGKS